MMLPDMGLRDDFLYMTPQAKATKAKEMRLHPMRKHLPSKIARKSKENLWNEKNYLQPFSLIRCQYPKHIKNLYNSTAK